MHMFRNPSDHRAAAPGPVVRTSVSSPEQDMEFDITVSDPDGRVKCVTVTYEIPPEDPGRRGRRGKPTEVVFTFENGLRPPRDS